MSVLTPLDWAALAVWAALWLGFSWFARSRGPGAGDLNAIMARYRHVWMRLSWRRENRITDIALMGNLMHSATFFSSTTLLVLGALFAFLGTVEQVPDVVETVSKLPFAARTSQHLLEAKAFALTLVFVYALLRFTWALRQFNLCCILIGAFGGDPDAPRAGGAPSAGPSLEAEQTLRAGRLNELAGVNFAQGLRAYYFSVPLLAWLINPWLMLASALLITLATYYMEFRSATVRVLAAADSGRPQR